MILIKSLFYTDASSILYRRYKSIVNQYRLFYIADNFDHLINKVLL